MFSLSTIFALLLVCGIALMLRAGLHLRRRRLGRASGNGLGAGACLVIGGLGAAVMLNLYTYQRLTYEQPVAALSFQRTGQTQYRVRLTRPDGQARTYRLAGTAWQLSARVLKWQNWANLIGLDARYRLDRVAGRYHKVERARHAPRTVYEIGTRGMGLSAWNAVHWLDGWLPLVDTRYGSAVYMPMADGARYKVALTQDGLVARAVNEAARRAVAHWPS